MTSTRNFTLGAIAGASSLALAVPLLAQFASAQTTSSSMRPAPTQACLQAMVTLDDAHLQNFDAMTAKHKQDLMAKRDALAAAASLTDDAQRQAALQKMHEDMRAMKDTAITPPEAITTAMNAVRAACGDKLGMRGMKFMHKFGGPMGKPMMGGGMHGIRRGSAANSPSNSL